MLDYLRKNDNNTLAIGFAATYLQSTARSEVSNYMSVEIDPDS